MERVWCVWSGGVVVVVAGGKGAVPCRLLTDVNVKNVSESSFGMIDQFM